MELATLSSAYGDFYAPAFSVRVGSDDLLRDALVAVSQVEAELVLGGASRFSFTVVSAYDIDDRVFRTGRGGPLLELLSFGAVVDICLGYGDARSMPRIVSGMVTEITTNFPESGTPELTVAGYDHSFPMINGKSSRTWAKKRDSDAVHEIASFHNLAAQVADTLQVHDQIEQNNESDFDFLKKLADRNHFELFVDADRTLHFHKPSDTSDAVVRLAWGEGLLSFKPEANLAGQVSRVEVYGWNAKTQEQFVGIAQAGEESGLDGKGKSAGDRLKRFVKDAKKQPTLRLRQPVFTQAEANARAKAALNEKAKQFLTGDADAIGLPEIRPDRNVRLDNLGAQFSKVYYVQQATHKVDGNGYRTRFKVKETAL